MLIYLASADPALCAAIVEQAGLLALPDLRLVESAALAIPASGEFPAAVIIDAPLMNKKLLATLQAETRKPKFFLLGDTNSEDEKQFITESFPKPIRLGHLMARLNFYLQTVRAQGEPFMFGPFRCDPQMRQVVVQKTGAVIRLTEKETHLLEYLGRSEKPVSREDLLAAIWGYDGRIDTHTLETHIYGLRRKLDAAGQSDSAIIARQGAYCLMASPC